jgi:macrolide transport system ATP-binding/permease protein
MKLWRRFRQFQQRRSFEADLAEELRIHREMAEAAAIRAGATPEEARRTTGRDFGGTALALEDSRAVWRFAWLSSLMQDVRFGLRGLRKSPGFALTVILTLALGLGTLGVSFSIFNALVLRPFAVRDPYSLYQLAGWGDRPGSYEPRSFSWNAFQDFRQRNGAFSETLGYSLASIQVDGKRTYSLAVSGNYFTMLGGRVCMGRPILESDDVSGNGVAVASYAGWKKFFGGAPDVIGRTIHDRKRLVEIVGVACPEFNGVESDRIDFWTSRPLSDPRIGSVAGRLKPGMTPEGAAAALTVYGQQVYSTWRYGSYPRSATLKQCATIFPLDRDSIAIFLPVFAAFGLVLLIACANVSNMMLARGLSRQREIGIRISLGAGRARVLRQLLTEGLLLAVPAALGAFCVAHGVIRAALWLQNSQLYSAWNWQRSLWNAAPDWHVLGFLVVAAGASTIIFGLIPALQTLRTRLVDANRGEFSTWRPARLRGILVLAQVTVCSLLLMASGVMLRNERRLTSQNMRLDAGGVFRLAAVVRIGGDLITGRPEATPLIVRTLLSLPQTETVATCMRGPGGGNSSDTGLPTVRSQAGADLRLPFDRISPEYLEMFHVPIRGRNITPGEAESGAPVIVISETAARRIFPGVDPLGRVIEVKSDPQVELFGGQGRRSFQIVGVVPDSSFLYNSEDRSGRTLGKLLLPLDRNSGKFNNILVRLKRDSGAGRRSIESAMLQVLPDFYTGEIEPIAPWVDAYLYPYRALVAISGFLGVLALLLTVSGVFGVSSYSVAQRRKEFGIRIALGARDAQVTGLVLGQSLRFAIAGAALGAFAATVLAHLMRQAIPRLDLLDPAGYAIGALAVVVSAVAAAWIPARKAVRVDPAETLRCD